MLEACVSYGFLCEPFWLKLGPKGPDIHAQILDKQSCVLKTRLLEADPLSIPGPFGIPGARRIITCFTIVSFLLALFP